MADPLSQITNAVEAFPTSDPLVYHSDIHPDFIDGHAAYGGMLLSKVCFAAQHYVQKQYPQADQPHVASAKVQFLRPTPCCRLEIKLSELVIGKTTSVISAAATRYGPDFDDKNVLVATVVISNLTPRPDQPNMKTPWCLTPAPAPVDLSLLAEDRDPNWKAVPIIPWHEGRKGVAKTKKHLARTGPRTDFATETWLRAPPGEKFLQSFMGYLAMAAPNVMDEVFTPGIWSNPVEKSKEGRNPYDLIMSSIHLDIKGLLPPEGAEWVFIHGHCKKVYNGRWDTETVVFDENNNIIMVANIMLHMVDFEKHAPRVKSNL